MSGKPRDLRGIFTGSDAFQAIRDRAQRLREAIDADERVALREQLDRLESDHPLALVTLERSELETLAREHARVAERERIARHYLPKPSPIVVEELKDETRELLRAAAETIETGAIDDDLVAQLRAAADAEPLPPLRHLEDPLDRPRSSGYTPADRVLLDAAAALRRGTVDDRPEDHDARLNLADELESLVLPPETVRVQLPRTAALVILDHLARRPRSSDPGPTDADALEEWLLLSYARLLEAHAIATARVLEALYPDREAQP